MRQPYKHARNGREFLTKEDYGRIIAIIEDTDAPDNQIAEEARAESEVLEKLRRIHANMERWRRGGQKVGDRKC